MKTDKYGKHYQSGLMYNDLVGFIELNQFLELEYQGIVANKIDDYGNTVWFYTADPTAERCRISQPLLFHIIRTSPKLREELANRPAHSFAESMGGKVVQ